MSATAGWSSSSCVASALSAAAGLRAGGRIFLGWEDDGDQPVAGDASTITPRRSRDAPTRRR